MDTAARIRAREAPWRDDEETRALVASALDVSLAAVRASILYCAQDQLEWAQALLTPCTTAAGMLANLQSCRRVGMDYGYPAGFEGHLAECRLRILQSLVRRAPAPA